MEPKYRVYGRRWLMLLLGFVINFVLIVVEQPFTPSASVAARHLGVSVANIHWLKYAWSIPAVASALPGLFAVEKLGLQRTGLIHASLLIVGVSLRCGMLAVSIHKSTSKSSVIAYVWVVLGSVVASLGAIPMQASTTYIAASWFDDNGRGFANTLVRHTAPIVFQLCMCTTVTMHKALQCTLKCRDALH
jgi:hypothetical protein